MIPDLTPAEIERLALLGEEMGETIQAIGKILRHGYESRHPDGGPTNRSMLQKEIGDVRAAVSMLAQAGDISVVELWRHQETKEKNVRQYLHHQGENRP